MGTHKHVDDVRKRLVDCHRTRERDMEFVERLIAGVLSFLLSGLVVMLMFNWLLAPELQVPDISYAAGLIVVLILRMGNPPDFGK